MITVDGLDGLLATARQPALRELRGLLQQVLASYGSAARLVQEQKLRRSRVRRLQFEVDGQPHSLIAKRFWPSRGLRERAALTRWMPAVGLGAHVPRLLGTAAENTGRLTWHVYEDAGDWTLDRGPFDPDRVREAVELIVQIHVRFAGHRLLGEIRTGGDRGAGFFGACVRDAANALRSLRAPAADLSAENLALLERLLSRLRALELEQSARAAELVEHGGVETFLHGDLWLGNVMVMPPTDSGDRPVVMIDWDHAGVGPVVYDLSTLLVRFKPDRRRWVLDLYRDAARREAGWELPDADRLNRLFETCEYARLANALIWAAIAAADSPSAGAFEELAEIERWFEKLQPVL